MQGRSSNGSGLGTYHRRGHWRVRPAGAARAYFQRSFSDKVFVISFFSNVITATLLVFLGNQLGVGSQLQTAVIVVLGIRIFTNVSSIRRFIFKG